MIPPTLAAFRALMQRGADAAYYASTDVLSSHKEQEAERQDMDSFRALATATPEQLLGIAFVIRDEYQQDTAAGSVNGYYVTPHDDPLSKNG